MQAVTMATLDFASGFNGHQALLFFLQKGGDWQSPGALMLCFPRCSENFIVPTSRGRVAPDHHLTHKWRDEMTRKAERNRQMTLSGIIPITLHAILSTPS
jgi:hypothetical protein